MSLSGSTVPSRVAAGIGVLSVSSACAALPQYKAAAEDERASLRSKFVMLKAAPVALQHENDDTR